MGSCSLHFMYGVTSPAHVVSYNFQVHLHVQHCTLTLAQGLGLSFYTCMYLFLLAVKKMCICFGGTAEHLAL